MTYTKKERKYYNIHREKTCKALNITKYQYNYLRRKGEALRKVYVDHCNGDFSLENNETILEKEILNKACDLKLYLYLQTDPRGATIYLDKKPIPENNYTQAYCIY